MRVRTGCYSRLSVKCKVAEMRAMTAAITSLSRKAFSGRLSFGPVLKSNGPTLATPLLYCTRFMPICEHSATAGVAEAQWSDTLPILYSNIPSLSESFPTMYFLPMHNVESRIGALPAVVLHVSMLDVKHVKVPLPLYVCLSTRLFFYFSRAIAMCFAGCHSWSPHGKRCTSTRPEKATSTPTKRG